MRYYIRGVDLSLDDIPPGDQPPPWPIHPKVYTLEQAIEEIKKGVPMMDENRKPVTLEQLERIKDNSNNLADNIDAAQTTGFQRSDAQNQIYNACVSYPVSKVKSVFANSAFNHMQLLCIDQNYYTVTKSTWDQVITAIASNHLTYEVDRFDCDKFAMYFSVMCALDYGINSSGLTLDYTGQHAYNVLLVAPDNTGDDPTFMALEPQTGAYVLTPDAHHVETSGVIIFN